MAMLHLPVQTKHPQLHKYSGPVLQCSTQNAPGHNAYQTYVSYKHTALSPENNYRVNKNIRKNIYISLDEFILNKKLEINWQSYDNRLILTKLIWVLTYYSKPHLHHSHMVCSHPYHYWDPSAAAERGNCVMHKHKYTDYINS